MNNIETLVLLSKKLLTSLPLAEYFIIIAKVRPDGIFDNLQAVGSIQLRGRPEADGMIPVVSTDLLPVHLVHLPGRSIDDLHSMQQK